MSNIEVNYPCGRPPIPLAYTQRSCNNSVSPPPTGSISYHPNNGAVPTGAPVYPTPNPHHHRRHSGNVRYNPYQHHRQTSAAAPCAPVGHPRSTTGGHDGHGPEVPYSEHNRRSLGEPNSSYSRRPRLAHPHLSQRRSARRQPPPSFVISETDDFRSWFSAPICAGTDGAMYYQGQVPLAHTYTSQPHFAGHAAQGQGDSRGPSANEGSVQPVGGVGNLAATTATATATNYTYEQFVPSSAFPATPVPLVTFDNQARYGKQSVHLTENEYSYLPHQCYQPDGFQSIVQSDIGVADDTAAAGLIQSLFTVDSNSLDMNLSAGYTTNCRPDLANLSFSGPEGTPSSFQATQPQHVYGQRSASLDLSAGLVAPAPFLGMQDIASFASIAGGDCPTPALMPPTPKTGSSSSFLHPVPLPCNEPTVGGNSHCNSSEPATPPFLVPGQRAPVPATAAAMPYDSSLPPPPSTKPRRQAHTPSDLERDPTLKFLPSQRAAAARAFEHVKNKPNLPIPTAFLGPPLSSAVVMKDGVQRARCLCEGCIGVGDESGQGEGWRRLDHLWCHMRKEHFGCVVYRCTEW
jgi:hypothetical protein